jgi:protein translocase SecG subunit
VQFTYNLLLGLAILIAVVFSLLVFVTGKGDAMSGGTSVRTTFKGKAGFDDFVSRLTLALGVGFMALMLVLDIVSHQMIRLSPLAYTKRRPGDDSPGRLHLSRRLRPSWE